MSDKQEPKMQNSLIDLGELSKPVTVFVQKVCDAVGVLYEPTRIKRAAGAKAEEMRLLANAAKDVQDTGVVADIQRDLRLRTAHRFIAEEERKQLNMESILDQALPLIEAEAPTEKVEEDWLVNAFDKCRLISDQTMQQMWAKVLAGEANKPGQFSKRTVNLVATLSKADAVLFSRLCNVCVKINESMVPFVVDTNDELFRMRGLDFMTFKHLQSIGLVTIEIGDYVAHGLPELVPIKYFDETLTVKFSNSKPENRLPIGKVALTQSGVELYSIVTREPVPGFLEYIRRFLLTRQVEFIEGLEETYKSMWDESRTKVQNAFRTMVEEFPHCSEQIIYASGHHDTFLKHPLPTTPDALQTFKNAEETAFNKIRKAHGRCTPPESS